MTLEEGIARAVHGANCGWNAYLDDPAPDPTYDALSMEDREMILDRVKMVMEGYGPETIHDAWIDLMLSRGWNLGDRKNPAGSPPTHPCLKDWRDLPPVQQVKDSMAVAIVKNLAAAAQDQAWQEMVQLGEELQG
jgi:hypothetical protein